MEATLHYEACTPHGTKASPFDYFWSNARYK